MINFVNEGPTTDISNEKHLSRHIAVLASPKFHILAKNTSFETALTPLANTVVFVFSRTQSQIRRLLWPQGAPGRSPPRIKRAGQSRNHVRIRRIGGGCGTGVTEARGSQGGDRRLCPAQPLGKVGHKSDRSSMSIRWSRSFRGKIRTV